MIVLLIVAHALRHVQTEQPHQEKLNIPPVSVITPEFLDELRMLLIAPTVSEKRPTTPLLPGALMSIDEQETPPVALLLPVSEAYQQGIPRREICSHLHWESAKYRMIVKPVLDAYEQQGQQNGSDE